MFRKDVYAILQDSFNFFLFCADDNPVTFSLSYMQEQDFPLNVLMFNIRLPSERAHV
jgi:hypothetical protein